MSDQIPHGAQRPDHQLSPQDLAGNVRRQIHIGERILAADTRRSCRNVLASTKLLMLVLIVSVAMGIAAWAFLASLDIVTNYREEHPWVFCLLPVVSVVTAWLYRNHGLMARRGNNLVIDSALSTRLIHARMAVLTFCCSVATHLAGGSAGREGAAVQIGGTIASNVSHLAHLAKHDHHDLMLAGIAAAFGGVFGSPLAGAFFGMEMCFVGKIDYTAGIYCLVASCTGNAVAEALGTVHEVNTIAHVPALSPASIALAVVAGVAFGLAARLFTFLIRSVKGAYARLFCNYLVAAAVGSLVLVAIYAVFGLWRFAGLSTWLVGAGFAGKTTFADALAKLVVTAFTLGCGYQGGEVTPLFGIGAALGGWIGCVAGVDPSFVAALGMLGVFCAGLNVPVTTIMMSIDMFHGQGAIYFVIVSFVSYIVAGHRGVYPAQRIVSPKLRSLVNDEGGTVEEAIERHHELLLEEHEEAADTTE